MKKIMILMLSMVMLMSFTIQCYAITFSDVADNAWFKDYVYDLAGKGVINGYPDGTYKPDDAVTVGAFLKLIMIASTGDKVNYDLVETQYQHWAAPYLKVAENADVLSIGEYTKEDLDRPITRIEIVRILTRCDLIIKETPQKSSSKFFTDTSNISDDDRVYLSHAVGIGVINGDPAGTFRPNDGLIRSECAKVIYTYTNR